MKYNKKTSSKIAEIAGSILQENKSSKIQKKLAASALSQSRTTNRTSLEMEVIASSVLKSSKYSNKTKTLAGSVLSQGGK